MNVLITEAKRTQHGSFHLQATCGKVSAFVSITSYDVQVICQNSAHRAWRGFGKLFPTVADAMDNYKSAEMKAIIATAAEQSAA